LYIVFKRGTKTEKLLSEKYGYGTARKNYCLKRWYPEQGLSTYEYANTVERWNKLLLQISRK
jgi:hypothetical protein